MVSALAMVIEIRLALATASVALFGWMAAAAPAKVTPAVKFAWIAGRSAAYIGLSSGRCLAKWDYRTDINDLGHSTRPSLSWMRTTSWMFWIPGFR